MAQETAEQIGFMERVENLLTAIEIYREVEESTIFRIKEILRENGIEISTEEIRRTDRKEIKERLFINKEVRKKEEAAMEDTDKTYACQKREEEEPCRR